MPHFDLHVGSDFRLFSEFKFDYVTGRVGGPRPGVDQAPGEVHQAFLEIGPHVSRAQGHSLRLGRQEVVHGTGRLFDTVPARVLSRGMADLYSLGLATKAASYNRGSATELRHTVGLRAFRPPFKSLDYNWEANYQWGSFGRDSIVAWSVSTETGYTLNQVRFRPRPMLRADVYSGDGNPTGNTLGTSNSFFPRGAYFTPKVIPFPGPAKSDRPFIPCCSFSYA